MLARQFARAAPDSPDGDRRQKPIAPARRAQQKSGDLDIVRLLALGAVGDIEAHPLSFGQRLEPVRLNCGKVGEEIFAAAVGRNETKTLRIVKPLDATCCHILNLRKMTGQRAPGWGEIKKAR